VNLKLFKYMVASKIDVDDYLYVDVNKSSVRVDMDMLNDLIYYVGDEYSYLQIKRAYILG